MKAVCCDGFTQGERMQMTACFVSRLCCPQASNAANQATSNCGTMRQSGQGCAEHLVRWHIVLDNDASGLIFHTGNAGGCWLVHHCTLCMLALSCLLAALQLDVFRLLSDTRRDGARLL